MEQNDCTADKQKKSSSSDELSSTGEESQGSDFKLPALTLAPKDKLEPSPLDVPDEVPVVPAPKSVKKEPSAPKENPPLPYTEPKWGGEVAEENYSFEVLKTGSIVETIALNTKSFYLFGRLSNCDIQMNHPSTSRYHAVLQYRSQKEGGNPRGFYVYDLKSTHGTYINKQRIKPQVYAPVRVGHMLQIGGSTRMLILQGPDEDAEPESQFTVTELLQQKRERDQEKVRMEALKIAEEKELEEKRRMDEENAGIDWGMGEDADEETDLTENPFASTTNEDLYLEDPKKTLRGWFEREGEELVYDCQEKTNGQFLCRVTLPVDDAMGRQLVAETLVRGKKKEAVVQCALEACRILDRQGLLRKATHESRSKKRKDWDEEGDSDDDTFLDRTGAVEIKRQRKLEGKSGQKVQTYDTLIVELESVREQIQSVEAELTSGDKEIAKKQASQKGDLDELDAYMSDLKRDTTQDKIKRRAAKTQLLKLQQDEKRLVKMANIARPASLPELKVLVSEDSKKASFVGSRPVAKPKASVPTASMASTSSSFEAEEEDEDEGEQETEPEAENTTLAEKDTGISEKEEISTVAKPESSAKSKLGPSMPAEILAKYYEDPLLDDDDDDMEAKEPKRQRVRPRHSKGNKNNPKGQFDDESGDYSTWVPPVGQSGDGRTKLNDKLGY